MERTTGRGLRRGAPGGGGEDRPTSKTGAHRAVRPVGGGGGTPPPSDTGAHRRGGGEAPAGATTMGGMGLGAKFAMFIALTVAIASAVLVVAAYFTAADQMDEEIDAAGIRQAKVVSAYALQTIERHKIKDGKGDPIQGIANDLNKIIQLVAAENQPQATTYDKNIRARLEDIHKTWDTNPLEYFGDKADTMGLKAPEIINIAVTVGNSLIAAKVSTAISMSSPVPRGKKDDVEIQEGSYSDGGRTIRVREYKKEVLDASGGPVGTAIIYLSARKIDDAKSTMLSRLMVPLLLACVIGAGIGFYLSTIVTKPLKGLLTDINIVSGGDLEHETRASSTDEIGYLAKTFNLMTKSLASAHQAELETKAMEHELNIATEIQSNLLPHRIPKIPGFEIGAYYRPSKEVGGDYYDFIQIDQNHLGVIVADVSGKGIPGSMVMTMARSLIRMEAERNLSTADTLVKTNRILARDIRRGMFVTCLYALMDIRSRTMLVSSAGHNPMVVYRQAAKKYELVNPNGIALGFDKGPIFERTIKEQQIQLNPGDRVVLYTDGVVEAMDGKNVEFGDDRFYKMVQLLAEKDSNVFINTIVKALDDHKGEAPQHDDITLVTVRMLPQG